MKHAFTFLGKFIVLCLVAFQVQAQMTLDYAKGLGSTLADMGTSIAVDASGNTFALGTFIGTVEFNPTGTSRTLTSNGSTFTDFYLAKYSSTGLIVNATDIFKKGNSNIDRANKVYVDASGNVYIVGTFFGSVTFGTSGFTGTLAGGSGKAFIAKYDNNLGFLWAIAFGNGGAGITAEAKDIVVDGSGNVFVTGEFQGTTIDFNPGHGGFPGTGADAGPYTPVTASSNGTTDIFVAKYSSGGTCQWVSTAGGISSDQGLGIDYDNAGNIYVTGAYIGQNVDFDPSGATFNLSEYGGGSSGDAFVAKYSSAGALINAFTLGSALVEKGNAIAVEKSTGDFAVAGYFLKDINPVDFDPSGTIVNGVGSGMNDMFVAKYTTALAYKWHKVIASTTNDAANGLRLAGSTLYVTGSYSGTTTNFGDSQTLSAVGGTDAFIAKYDFASLLGTCLSAYSMGGASNEEGWGIAQSGSKVYITGAYSGSGDYDPSVAGVTTLTNAGSTDIFIARYTDVICTSPTIDTNPVGLSRCQGTSATFSVTASGPGPITYQWKKAGADITSETGTSYTIPAVAVGDAANYTVAVTNSCSTVISAIATLTVSTPVTANAGTAQALCNTTTATLAGSSPSPGTGAWTTTSGTGVVTTPSSATSGITGLTVGAASTFLWTVTNGACVTTSIVTITVSSPVTSNAGTAQSLCNVTTATLAATVPSPGTGVWSTTAGTGVVTTVGSATSGVTGLTVGASSTFQWTVTNGACSANSSVTITSSASVTSNAGTAQTICNSTTGTFAATVPSPGTGAWTTTSGTGTATTPSSATSGVTGLTVGASSTFLWTVTNGACSASSSVTITVSAPVTSNAGTASNVCNSTTSSLSATVPSPGTGAWTTISGTGVATTPSSATSAVTGLTVGAATTFQWTVTNGACTATSTKTITSNAPVTSNAGSAQTICNATTATLAATPPSPGSGVWTRTAGTGTVTFASNPASGITGLTVGASSTFQWTVTNGACIANSSVIITSSSPVTSNAGTAQSLCNTTTATLAATVPSPGTGAWTTTSGSGIASAPSSATSGVTGLTVGAASTFQWTVTNGACSATSSVTITSSSPVTSNAGSAQTLCNATTATLAAVNPPLGTGAWTTTSGTGTASTPASNTSAVTGLTVGAASTFQWTVTNGACSATSSVTITSSSPVTSNAGTAQSICNLSTATLAATVPSPGTGAWTTTSGSGLATTPSSATSGVTGLTIGGSSTFQWTVTNGACSATSSVTITSSSLVVANAGAAQSLCNVTTTTLAATNPSSGTGAWTTTSGSGVATTPSSATSGVTALTIGAATTFQWTVTNGACVSNSSVTVTVSAPGVPDAGTDQTICNSTTATLAGSGTGTWSTVSGTGVATSVSNPTSGVTGLTIGGTTVFQWTVTNGACSGSSQVSIIVSAPVTSNAGTAQTICNSTTGTLAATAPSPGTGAWSTTSGTGTATTVGSASSAVTGLTVGAPSTFQWTVTNGACSASSSVTITVSSPVTATAGSDQTLCNVTTATLGATPPSTGTGLWTKTSGTGAITTASSATSGVTGLTAGTSSVFLWTVTNGACTANASVTITSNAPVTANAGTAQTICNSTTGTLAATVPSPGIGAWTTTAGTGIATTPSSATSAVTGLTLGGASTFLWTVTNGACSATSSVTLTVVTPLSFTTDPITQTLCTGSPLNLTGVVSGSGTITYQWKKGASNVSNGGTITGANTATLNISSLIAADAGSYTLVASNTCGPVTSNAAVITVSSSVLSITTQPVSQALCSGSDVTFNVVATGTGTLTYQWKKGASPLSDGGTVSGATTTSVTITTLSASDAANYTVEVTNACGTISSNAAVLTIDAPVITTQPIDQDVCSDYLLSATFTVVAIGPSLTYQWQKGMVDIVGATSATLNVSNVVSTDAALYRCNVTACSSTIASNEATLNALICDAVVNGEATDEAMIYPNPTRSELHVKLNGNDKIQTITIVNGVGTVVYKQREVQATAVDLSLDHLSQGLYHVIIESDRGRRVEQLEILN